MIGRHKPPYIRSSLNTSYAYAIILVALIPCICNAVLSYGVRSFVLVLSSALLFFFFDYIFAGLLNNSVRKSNFVDINSLVNGIIFGLLLPPNTSLLMVVIGALFGSLVIKQLFGGIGNNLFNQAAASRLFIELVFPSYLHGYSNPFSEYLRTDSLLSIKPIIGQQTTNVNEMYFAEIINGSYSTLIGLGSLFTILIGMLYLILKKTTKPYISIFYILSSIMGYVFLNGKIFAEMNFKGSIKEVAVFVVTSGILFTATYLLAVYSNVPIGFRGSIVAGIISGLIASYLYSKASVAITICMPVLLVNLITPVVEYLLPHRHTKKATFTEDKKEVHL